MSCVLRNLIRWMLLVRAGLVCAGMAVGTALAADPPMRILPNALSADPSAFESLVPATGSATPWVPKISIFELSDSLVAFYDGRDQSLHPDWLNVPGTWTSFDSGLGTAVFVVHDQGEAMVLDSLWTRSQGEFIRRYMTERHGVKRFTLVLSHWHLDHIGGNGAFADSAIVSSARTAEILAGYEGFIRDGKLWGPPAMPDFTLPNVTFNDRMALNIGDIEIELSHYRVHSDDHIFLRLPAQRLGLVGDMIEDTVPVMSHPEQTPQHLKELARLRLEDMNVLYPNHGNPKVIAAGGYDKRAIDAAIEYQRNMLLHAQEADFLEKPLEFFTPIALREGVVTLHEYYRVAHEMSRRNVYNYWRDKAMPQLY